MIVNFVNVNRNGTANTNPDPLFVADENAAKAILESTFFNNIMLTFNVGLGFSARTGRDVTGSGVSSSNAATQVDVTYDNLRTALLNSGQPNFFNDANLPAGDGLPINVPPAGQMPVTISNFWLTSSQQKALGLPSRRAGVDGFIGIGTTVAAGLDRVATLLHEVGHAMGRFDTPQDRGRLGTWDPEMDLVRFTSKGNRLIIEGGGGFFSLDGGATSLVNWSLLPAPPPTFSTRPITLTGRSAVASIHTMQQV